MIVLILICLLTPQFTPVFHPTFQETKAAAQSEVDLEKLKQQAQELSDAMINGNFNRAADLTFPTLIRLMGGRERFMVTAERMMKETQGTQFRILSVVVGEPRDVEKIGREHFAIVPTKMRIKVPDGLLIGEGFMIGISNDGGKNWTFVDSGQSTDKTKLSTLFGPAAAQKLRIPETKRPVLIANPVNKPGRY